jgi:hypothetical protein
MPTSIVASRPGVRMFKEAYEQARQSGTLDQFAADLGYNKNTLRKWGAGHGERRIPRVVEDTLTRKWTEGIATGNKKPMHGLRDATEAVYQKRRKSKRIPRSKIPDKIKVSLGKGEYAVIAVYRPEQIIPADKYLRGAGHVDLQSAGAQAAEMVNKGCPACGIAIQAIVLSDGRTVFNLYKLTKSDPNFAGHDEEKEEPGEDDE